MQKFISTFLKNTQICILVLFVQTIHAQNTWQQKVQYNIDVKLNDTLHTLEGIETFTYYNNSPDTLQFLYLHLWPNAYKNDKTAFNKQKVLNGDTKFYYSKPSEKGYIKNLEFTVDGKAVSYADYNSMEDVVILNLPKPLLPGQSTEVSTPFYVKIPKVFSRMGHGLQDYQITQWYVKPAVYDQFGWHPMPYLEQGEFYSEYAKYTVNISVPNNYIVAATGDLQTENEKIFLQNKIAETKKFKADTISKKYIPKKIESNYNFKTIQFIQENVHDFAWFADKNFLVEKSSVQLNNNKEVETYIYYLPQNSKYWKGQTAAINETIKFLSDSVGNYPYKHASAVDGGLVAGSGMEYPNVTVIGNVPSKKTLSTVIIHEVGHNWFYGLLGTNERDHAWLDEGFNTFYEQKIDKQFSAKLNDTSLRAKLENSLNLDANSIIPFLSTQHKLQPANKHSADYGALAYGLSVYNRAANLLKHLEAYLGATVFTNCMQEYFKAFCYKHPYPKDVQTIFEKTSGKNLDWFFENLVNTNSIIDFKITNVQIKDNVAQIQIKNKSKTLAPALVTLFYNDSLVTQFASEPFKNTSTVNVTQAFTKVVLDHKKITNDVNLKNNFYNTKGILHKTAFGIKPLAGLKNSNSNNIYVLPMVGYNYHNGIMAGLCLHNLGLANSKLQYAITPMYATSSNSVVGFGALAYNIYTNKIFSNISVGINASKFSNDDSKLNLNKKINTHFTKIVPNIIFTFINKKYPQLINTNLAVRQYILGNQALGFNNNFTDSLYRPFIEKVNYTYITQLTYTHTNDRTFNPFSYVLDAHGNNNFAKLSATGNIKLNYNLPKKALYLRAFAGKMLDLSNGKANNFAYRFATTATAQNDYLFNNYFIGRGSYNKVITNQVDLKEGGAKVPTNLLSRPYGLSDNYILACNISTDLPIKLPVGLRLYADLATTKNNANIFGISKENMASAGLQLNLFNNAICINAPFIMSNNYKSYFKSTYGKRYLWQSMSFSIQANGASLYKLFNNKTVAKLF